ncbi:GSCOCG00010717001-RA-CDS [Cotesia congregata]|uniref:Snurportin-1 n=1 Tax=Cotesia congregata TaxID=51543 RepID=A0A8J2MIE7_COTCN|nr:GSCOCG00010717001-RA-CDS [Cotesia congregata]CAG5093445.1 Similar to SNUPN: Snurportin-1 (Homo sapiens) [Cotesia congregata]
MAQSPGLLNDIHEKNSRSLFYKKPVKKDNYNLDTDYDYSHQENRRRDLLNRQKESRSAVVNSARAILEEVLLSESECDEPATIDYQYRSKRNKLYINTLMLSEWMIDIPENFCDEWFMLPCPKGKRALIVARKGKTQVFTRRGNKIIEFNSALPGGNYEHHSKNSTILDCIWVKKDQSYYVLDVLSWSNQTLLDCDAEFRHFWLSSKLGESPEFSEQSKFNKYPFVALPNIFCNENLSDFVHKLSSNLPLDGFLFYHRKGFYMNGHSPLVTWLKPFMISEVLGISVPPELDKKPEGYLDFEHYILSKNCRKKILESSNELQMDVTVNEDCEEE